jgi:hypothetical protein
MASDLRPLSLGEILDRTFTLYRSHFLLFVGIMAAPQLIGVALNLGLQGMIGPIFALPPGLDPAKAGVNVSAIAGRFFFAILVSAAINSILYSVALGATTLALSDLYFGHATTIRGAYQRVRRRFWGLMDVVFSVALRFFGLLILFIFGSAILLGMAAATIGRASPALSLIIGLVFFLLLIVGTVLAVWVVLRYGVAIPALLLEDLKARQALKRSVLLTRGYRGRLFLTSLLMSFVTYVVVLILRGPFWIAAALLAGKTGQIPNWVSSLSVVAAGVGAALSGPLLMIGLTLLYYDVRVRREAFDLQVMMAALEPSGPAPSPGTSGPPAVTGV